MSESPHTAAENRGSDPGDQRFAERVVRLGFCTQAQVEDAFETQKTLTAMDLRASLESVLQQKGILTQTQVQAVHKQLKPNPVIGGFEILEKVGQGGMGAVYRARQISMDRIVALKLLPKHLAENAQFKQRFLREARVSAQLNHLNLINGIDCGEANGHTFFAMEFVEGETVKAILDAKSRIPLPECLEITKQVASALSYAHAKQLVHRDIKPDNIMIARNRTAKLCDLGLARSMDVSHEDPSLTQAGRAVGTPHYIAPEQALGEEDIDARADLYSFAATIFHMLTGRTLFEGKASQAVMTRHLTDTAPSVCEINGDLPANVGMVLAKALAKKREHRYMDIDSFIRDLEAAACGAQVQAKSFSEASSCALPLANTRTSRASSPPFAGTTGPQAPVRARGTTGPQKNIAPRRSTGPLRAVKARNDGAAHPDRNPKRLRARIGIGLSAGAFLTILFALVINIAGSKKTTQHKAAKPSQEVENELVTKSAPRTGDNLNCRHAGPQATESDASKRTHTPPPPQTPITPPRALTSAQPLQPAGAKDLATSPRAIAPAANASPPSGPAETGNGGEPQKGEPRAASDSGLGQAPPEEHTEPHKHTDPAAAAVQPVPENKGPDLIALRAQFLQKLLERTQKDSLQNAYAAGLSLANDKMYAPSHEPIQSDLALLKAVAEGETMGFEKMDALHPEVALSKGLSALSGKATGKAKHFDPSRGLIVAVGNAELVLPCHEVPLTNLISANPELQEPQHLVAIHLFRGRFQEAKALMETLPEAQRGAMEQRLALLESGAVEVKAALAFENLDRLIKTEKWDDFLPAADRFLEQFGPTRLSARNGKQLEAWMAKARVEGNPMLRVFHAKLIKTLADGYVELEYDFSTPQQLKDFATTRGELVLSEGILSLRPPPNASWKERARIAQACIYLRVPVSDLRVLDITSKTSAAAKSLQVAKARLHISFSSPSPSTRDLSLPSCSYWFSKQRLFVHDPARSNLDVPSWKRDMEVALPGDPPDELLFRLEKSNEQAVWSANSAKSEPLKWPKAHTPFFVSLSSFAAKNAWRNCHIVFKPDRDWLQKNQGATGESAP